MHQCIGCGEFGNRCCCLDEEEIAALNAAISDEDAERDAALVQEAEDYEYPVEMDDDYVFDDEGPVVPPTVPEYDPDEDPDLELG